MSTNLHSFLSELLEAGACSDWPNELDLTSDFNLYTMVVKHGALGASARCDLASDT